MTIKDEIIEELKSSYKKPFLIYDKINGSPFNKAIEEILFSEDWTKFPFLGSILTNSISEEGRELVYFFRNKPEELRNFENEIYTLRSWLYIINDFNLDNFFSENEAILKIWKFESPDFVIETNFRTIGVEVISLFTKDTLADLDQKVNNPQESFQNYMKIKKGENETIHSFYDEITDEQVKNVEKHIKKVPVYNENLNQLTSLSKKIEIFIIINFGGGSRKDVFEKEALTNIISTSKAEQFSLDNIYIMIGVTNDGKLKNKSKYDWICLKNYENFNNWITF